MSNTGSFYYRVTKINYFVNKRLQLGLRGWLTLYLLLSKIETLLCKIIMWFLSYLFFFAQNYLFEMFHNLHAKYILQRQLYNFLSLILQLLKVLIVCTDMSKSSQKSSASIDLVCKFISQKKQSRYQINIYLSEKWMRTYDLQWSFLYTKVKRWIIVFNVSNT